MNNTKTLKWLFIVIVNACIAFFVIYFMLVYCLKRIEKISGKKYCLYNVRNVLTFPEQFANDKASSVLIMGSSGVEAGFDVSQIEKQLNNRLRVYNGGMGGSVFSDNFLFLEYALSRGGKQALPDILICGVTYLNFIDHYRNVIEQNKETQLIEALSNHTTFFLVRKADVYLISKYYHSMLSKVDFLFWDRFRIKDFLKSVLSNTYKSTLKICGINSFEPTRMQLIESGDKVARKSLKSDNFNFPNDQTRALYQVSEFCRDYNIKLVFLEMPESLELRKRYYSDMQREPYIRMFQDLSRLYPENAYSDLRNFLREDEFIDFAHANKKGIERLTKYLSIMIKEILEKT